MAIFLLPVHITPIFVSIFVYFCSFRGKKKSFSNLYILYASKQNVKVRVFLNMFYPLYPKVLQALKSFPNFVGVFSTVEQVGLVYSWIRVGLSVCMSLSICLSGEERAIPEPMLAQDVQVDWRGFSHGEQDLLHVLNVQSLLRFPLPAAEHDVIHLLRTNPRPLQNPTLGYALNNLQRRGAAEWDRRFSHTDCFCLFIMRNWWHWAYCPLRFELMKLRWKKINRMHSVLNLCNINRKQYFFLSHST